MEEKERKEGKNEDLLQYEIKTDVLKQVRIMVVVQDSIT
jgi:hypothetical protein